LAGRGRSVARAKRAAILRNNCVAKIGRFRVARQQSRQTQTTTLTHTHTHTHTLCAGGTGRPLGEGVEDDGMDAALMSFSMVLNSQSAAAALAAAVAAGGTESTEVRGPSIPSRGLEAA
jgi:hypothetical protein